MEKGELLDRTGPGFPIVSETESHGLAKIGASKQPSPAISSFARASQYQLPNHEPKTAEPTLVFGFQLGEFRLCAIGLTSDSGPCPAILMGEFASNHQDSHKQKNKDMR